MRNVWEPKRKNRESDWVQFVEPLTLYKRAVDFVATWQHYLLKQKRTKNNERPATIQ